MPRAQPAAEEQAHGAFHFEAAYFVYHSEKTALLIPSVETLLLMVQVHTLSNVCSVINLRGQNWRGSWEVSACYRDSYLQ
jgi:hypothetical protein